MTRYLVKKVVHGGDVIFTASRNVLRVFDAQTQECVKVQKMKGDISDMVLGGDGSHLFIATEKTVRAWDVVGMRLSTVVTTRVKLGLLQLVAPDAVAATSMNKIFILSDLLDDGGSTSAPVELSPPHYDKVMSITTAGPYLFSGSRDYSLKRWDQNEANGKWSCAFSVSGAHESYVSALHSFDGGRKLLSGSVKGCLKLWDVATCRCIGEVAAHTGSINDITVQDATVFTASGDGTVRVWEYGGQLGEGPVFRRRASSGGESTSTPSSIEDKKSRRLTYDLGEVMPPTLALAAEEKNVARKNESSDTVSVLSLAPTDNDLNATYKLKMPTRATKTAWMTSAARTRAPEGGDDEDSDDVGYREDVL